MLKFIVAESTGNKVAQFLINEGFDVVSVIRQMRGSDDLTIIQKAIAEGWMTALKKGLDREFYKFVRIDFIELKP